MNWRARHPVLVVEAQTIGAVGVIRSLGAAGYPVIACAATPDALGFRSRYPRKTLIHPSYLDPAFIPWLRGTIARFGIKAIVPSEGLLLALRPAFAEFCRLLPMKQDEAAVYGAMSKFDLFRAFANAPATSEVHAHLPPYCLIDADAPLPTLETLDALGAPLYAKADGCYARSADAGGKVQRLTRRETWDAELNILRQGYSRLLVQGHVAGRGAGVFLLRHRGEILARFMHLRLHEVPPEGGVSSLRKSWWHEAMYADAVRRMALLDWEGVAMFEYRWDEARDTFSLMEMNARFWGSLHLALHAGVDFPRLLLDAFFGHADDRRDAPARPITARLTFPLEADYVLYRLRDTRLSLRARLGSVVEWLRLGVDPNVKSDLWLRGDTGVYWSAIARYVRHLTQLIGRKLTATPLVTERRRVAKLALLGIAKASGLFWVSGWLFRRHLHILCYHGTAFTDEHEFRPGLFMSAGQFGARLAWLKRRGYTIIPLAEGLARMRAGTLTRKTAVITIDDGFYSTGAIAAPLLRQHRFPATLYVTSYYMQRQNPIYGLVVQYMFWKTKRSRFDADGLIPGLAGMQPTRGADGEALMERLVTYGETACTEERRVELARMLGQRLEVDYDELIRSRRLSLLTAEEVRALPALGVDVQLHTHRHRLPLDNAELAHELDDNRRALEPLTGTRLTHLCYPSGIWSPTQWEALRAAGVESATTCEIGPNAPDAPALGLRRVLERENMTNLEIEAELSGFAELLRQARARLGAPAGYTLGPAVPPKVERNSARSSP